MSSETTSTPAGVGLAHPAMVSAARSKRAARPQGGRGSKYETRVTLAHGGNHSPRQTGKAWDWLDACSLAYISPRLYHLAFVMADDAHKFCNVDHIHAELLKRLMQHLRRKGIPATFFAAREFDDEKGAHLHAFVAVDASAKRPDAILNRMKDGWLAKAAARMGVKAFINPPRDPMHSGNDYMSLPPSKPAKIADAKVWISYLFKRRSKPADGEIIYSSSRMTKTIKNHQQATKPAPTAPGHSPEPAARIDGDIVLQAFAVGGICTTSPPEPIRITIGADSEHHAEDVDGEFRREREDAVPASAWVIEQGRHIIAPSPPSQQRQADRAVQHALLERMRRRGRPRDAPS